MATMISGNVGANLATNHPTKPPMTAAIKSVIIFICLFVSTIHHNRQQGLPNENGRASRPSHQELDYYKKCFQTKHLILSDQVLNNLIT
jgi:hypothetical protein